MKKGYLCVDGKHLNITGNDIVGLYDEPYIDTVEYLDITEIAHEVALDYSIFQGLKKLMISSLETFTFPTEICFLPLLEQITCSGKCLIPPEIGRMQNLKRLDVNGDCVLAMPESIVDAKHLTELSVNYYGEKAPCPMPAWIAALPQLQQLSLYLCHFSFIDSDIAQLTELTSLSIADSLGAVETFPSLNSLHKLERLEIWGSGNSGARIPKATYTLFSQVLDSFCELRELNSLYLNDWRSRKKADYLVLTEQGKSIPDIFRRHPKLKLLSLSGMRLDYLPPSVLHLPELKLLYADGNSLSEESILQLRSQGVEVKVN